MRCVADESVSIERLHPQHIAFCVADENRYSISIWNIAAQRSALKHRAVSFREGSSLPSMDLVLDARCHCLLIARCPLGELFDQAASLKMEDTMAKDSRQNAVCYQQDGLSRRT